jgi:hypothetical protein
MQSQVDRVVKEYQDEPVNEIQPEPKEDELQAFIDAMLLTITPILLANGKEQYEAGALLANFSLDDLQGFNLTEEATDSYKAYLKKVGESYGQDTAESIRKVLVNARDSELTRAETEKALKGIMDTDDWRVKRMGRTELNTAQQIGNIEGMKEIQAETGKNIYKTWHVNRADACEWCHSMNGTRVGIDQPFIPLGAAIVNDEGEILVNDWQDIQIAHSHPNCTCSMIWEIE